ncbi:MAG: hypothetical protein J6S21_03410, partial [Victivallales bacterium]|nr:hypothetical protein [Victivallales bacterium]
MKIAKTLKKTLAVICCAGAVTLSAADAAAPAAAPAAAKAPAVNVEELLKFIPAKVVEGKGEALLTRDELLKDLKPMLDMAVQQGVPVEASQVEAVAYNIAESLAISKLLLADAAKQEIKADAKAAEAQLKMMEEQLNAQQPGAFEAEMKKAGMTREIIMSKLLEQSIIQQYLEKVAAAAPKAEAVTDKEMKEFYEANKDAMKEPASLSAAHILI